MKYDYPTLVSDCCGYPGEYPAYEKRGDFDRCASCGEMTLIVELDEEVTQ